MLKAAYLDDTHAQVVLKGVDQRLLHNRMLMEGLAAFMIRSVKNTIKKGGPPGKWAPLASSTLAARRKGHTKPLYDTGTLHASIAKGQVTDNLAEVVSGFEFAAVHQYGATIPERTIKPVTANVLSWITPEGTRAFATECHIPATTIPARPFMVFRHGDREHIARAAAAFIEGVKGGGL